jgi:hypothetical protein
MVHAFVGFSFFFFFFYRAPTATAPGMYRSLQAYFTYPMLWKFPLAPPGAPTSTTTRETSSRETGIFYMPQICDMGQTKEGMLRIFSH